MLEQLLCCHSFMQVNQLSFDFFAVPLCLLEFMLQLVQSVVVDGALRFEEFDWLHYVSLLLLDLLNLVPQVS